MDIMLKVKHQGPEKGLTMGPDVEIMVQPGSLAARNYSRSQKLFNPISRNVFSKLFNAGGGAIIIHPKISCIGYIFAY